MLAKLVTATIRAKILGNDCGSGKTITYLLAAKALNNILRTKKENGEDVRFGAVLVIVPANVLPQAFEEAYDKFGQTFRLHSFYGAVNTCKSVNRRKATVDTKGFIQLLRGLDLADKDPDVSFTLLPQHARPSSYVGLRRFDLRRPT